MDSDADAEGEGGLAPLDIVVADAVGAVGGAAIEGRDSVQIVS